MVTKAHLRNYLVNNGNPKLHIATITSLMYTRDMRILQENQNILRFKVYPDKLYTFAMLFVIAIFAYGVFHYKLGTYDFLTSIILLPLFVIHTGISFLFPIGVTIDKSTGTLEYFDFSLFQQFLIRNQQEYMTPLIFRQNAKHTLAISHLRAIEVKNILGGALKLTFLNWLYNSRTQAICIQFITDNSEPTSILAGFFSFRRHQEACRKIASYLNIPFKDTRKDI